MIRRRITARQVEIILIALGALCGICLALLLLFPAFPLFPGVILSATLITLMALPLIH